MPFIKSKEQNGKVITSFYTTYWYPDHIKDKSSGHLLKDHHNYTISLIETYDQDIYDHHVPFILLPMVLKLYNLKDIFSRHAKTFSEYFSWKEEIIL